MIWALGQAERYGDEQDTGCEATETAPLDHAERETRRPIRPIESTYKNEKHPVMITSYSTPEQAQGLLNLRK